MDLSTRFKRGDENIAAILTPELVIRLRQMRANGATYRELSDEFGIDRKHAWRICQGIAWNWLND